MLEAEEKAILKACHVANNLQVVKIIIENDCKPLVDTTLGFCSAPGLLLL